MTKFLHQLLLLFCYGIDKNMKILFKFRKLFLEKQDPK
jgi:hypothetical protein